MNRVCVFIDGSNFYHNLKNSLGETHIDFSKFLKNVCDRIGGEARLIRCYYYNAPVNKQVFPERAKEQQRFLDKLRFIPKFEVRLGRLEKKYYRCPMCGEKISIECPKCSFEAGFTFIEKEVDVKIAVDMISFARKDIYDVGVLVSNDGDFKSVLQELKELGKMTVYAGFSVTNELQEHADDFIKLDKKYF